MKNAINLLNSEKLEGVIHSPQNPLGYPLIGWGYSKTCPSGHHVVERQTAMPRNITSCFSSL